IIDANGSVCVCSEGAGVKSAFAAAFSAIAGSFSEIASISNLSDHSDDNVIAVENRGTEIDTSSAADASEISSATTASLGINDNRTGPSSRMAIPLALDSCRLSSERAQSVEIKPGRRKRNPTTKLPVKRRATAIFLTSTNRHDQTNHRADHIA